MIKRLVVIVGEGPCPTASDMANKLNEVIGAINQNTPFKMAGRKNG